MAGGVVDSRVQQWSQVDDPVINHLIIAAIKASSSLPGSAVKGTAGVGRVNTMSVLISFDTSNIEYIPSSEVGKGCV